MTVENGHCVLNFRNAVQLASAFLRRSHWPANWNLGCHGRSLKRRPSLAAAERHGSYHNHHLRSYDHACREVNVERSHAGPTAFDQIPDALPAWAGATGWANRRSSRVYDGRIGQPVLYGELSRALKPPQPEGGEEPDALQRPDHKPKSAPPTEIRRRKKGYAD